MKRDAIVAAAVVLAFAALVAAHVAIVASLARCSPRWRALAALVAAPLAPYWGWREGMRWRARVWVVAALAYGVARVLASF
jgi:hypothetical protein